MTGRVSYLSSRGFGYLRGDDRQRYFFHFNALRGIDFETLTPGVRVSFTPVVVPNRLTPEAHAIEVLE